MVGGVSVDGQPKGPILMEVFPSFELILVWARIAFTASHVYRLGITIPTSERDLREVHAGAAMESLFWH